MIAISNKDIQALKQTKKVMYCKFEILNKNYKVITEPLEGKVLSGNYSINADSDIRRTCNLTIALKNDRDMFDVDVLYNHYLRIYLGYTHLPTKEILYYSIGIYMFDKESFSYDISTNQLSFSLCDLTALMDAEHRGALYGAETSVIPAIDETTGKRNILKDVIIKEKEGILAKNGIKKFRVDDIGMRNCEGTSEYAWNEMPYDLEFSIGGSYLDMLKQIRDLYTNYEFFFDVDGTFIFQEKPSVKDDMIFLENDLIQELVISENTDSNVYDVKNVIEVWGKTFDFDKDTYIVEQTAYSAGAYMVTSERYSENGYVDKMKINLKTSNSNWYSGTTSINLTNSSKTRLGAKPIYDKLTGNLIKQNQLKAGTNYIFEYSVSLNNNNGGFYLLGVFQVHALAVMSDGTTTEDYAKRYNTKNIKLIVDPTNKFCVEKVGEIRKCFHGDKYANLDTDSLALDYAEDKLNQLCRKTTSLSLEMIIVPWLDVNQKITYKPSNSDEVKTYVTQSISGDLLSGVMSVNLREYYKTLDE